MKRLTIIILFTIGMQAYGKQISSTNNDCLLQIIKSSSNKNGIVKKTSGEIVTTKETMTLEINPCTNTVIVEINNKLYDLVIYKTDELGTIMAATLNGKQIIEIKVNPNTNEVQTFIGNLIFTTYIDTKIIDSRPFAVED